MCDDANFEARYGKEAALLAQAMVEAMMEEVDHLSPSEATVALFQTPFQPLFGSPNVLDSWDREALMVAGAKAVMVMGQLASVAAQAIEALKANGIPVLFLGGFQVPDRPPDG